MDIQLHKQAVELRKRGNSYTEIAKALKVSRASVCSWTKSLKLTEVERLNLHKNIAHKIQKGRMNALIVVRSKSLFKEKNIYESEEKNFEALSKDPFLMFGIGLTLSHGVKKGNTFQFSNSDPVLLLLLLQWVEKYFGFRKKDLKYRIFGVLPSKRIETEEFWLKSLAIPKTSLQKSIVMPKILKKGNEYKGSLCITVSNVHMMRRLIAWQKLTMRYYG